MADKTRNGRNVVAGFARAIRDEGTIYLDVQGFGDQSDRIGTWTTDAALEPTWVDEVCEHMHDDACARQASNSTFTLRLVSESGEPRLTKRVHVRLRREEYADPDDKREAIDPSSSGLITRLIQQNESLVKQIVQQSEKQIAVLAPNMALLEQAYTALAKREEERNQLIELVLTMREQQAEARDTSNELPAEVKEFLRAAAPTAAEHLIKAVGPERIFGLIEKHGDGIMRMLAPGDSTPTDGA